MKKTNRNQQNDTTDHSFHQGGSENTRRDWHEDHLRPDDLKVEEYKSLILDLIPKHYTTDDNEIFNGMLFYQVCAAIHKLGKVVDHTTYQFALQELRQENKILFLIVPLEDNEELTQIYVNTSPHADYPIDQENFFIAVAGKEYEPLPRKRHKKD